MRRYRHLSAEERDRIAEMHARHEGVSAIAAAIGRNKSTVSRGIARNGRNGRYGAIAAQSRSDARRKACRPRKSLSDPALAAEVRRRIVDDRRSPEQIDGRSRLERGGRCVVSFSTIYRAVNAGEPDPPIPIHLPLPAVRRFPLCCCIPMPYPLDNYAASSPPRLQERNVHDRTCIQAAPAHYGWPP